MAKNIQLFDILEAHNMTITEGGQGMENLNKLAKMMGYREDGFKYGSAFENFLKDNPGCIDAIEEWISAHGDNWADELEEYMPVEEDEETPTE